MGVRYLCPICEKELKGLRTYCHHCRSRVKEPLVFKGLHLPNESDCYRNDVDYMDPRNMKKQQEHFYQHKIEMPDRPTMSIGHEPNGNSQGKGQGLRRSLEDGRAWLQEQRKNTNQHRTVTYGTNKSTYRTTNPKKDSGFAWKVALFFVLVILGNC